MDKYTSPLQKLLEKMRSHKSLKPEIPSPSGALYERSYRVGIDPITGSNTIASSYREFIDKERTSFFVKHSTRDVAYPVRDINPCAKPFHIFLREAKFDKTAFNSGWGFGYIVVPKESIYFLQVPVFTPYLIGEPTITFWSLGDSVVWDECPNAFKTKDYWIIGFHTVDCEKPFDEDRVKRLAIYYKHKMQANELNVRVFPSS